MDNTIAGSIIPRRKLTICLKGRMYFSKAIAHVEQELLTLSEHMNSPPFLVGLVLFEVKFFVYIIVCSFLFDIRLRLPPCYLQTVLTTPTITYYISHCITCHNDVLNITNSHILSEHLYLLLSMMVDWLRYA